MSGTVKLNNCPKCGAPIPAGAPQGLCPKCVLMGAAAPTDAGVPPTATSEIPSLERVAAAFPQLEIVELIGRGGMGFVFKARQPRLDRWVALKLLPDKLARDPRFAERFNREGRVLAKLNHPNIVSVYDFGQTEHFYFLIMEFVDGVNLRQAMQAGRFSPGEALSIVPKICEALQYAHGQGVLHRDIKPENILLDARGQLKIADFGIAKLVGDDKPDVVLTGTGSALGTPHYMAPEQLETPSEVDHRADIYSLGVVFYEMLTGELPIGRFAAPSSKTPVGAAVDEVVFRTLEKDRERRYQSAGEMKTEVEHLGEGAKTVPPLPGEMGGLKWSLKAVWGAVLTGLSLPWPVLLAVLAYFAGGGIGKWEILLAMGALCLPGLAGCVLGWWGLSDIRAQRGQLRGLPLAVLAALTWPVLLLLGFMLLIPWIMSNRGGAAGPPMVWLGLLTLLVPAGAITFAIWMVYATVRWAGNDSGPHRRGVLKWVFICLLLAGVGVLVKRNYAGRPGMPPLASSELLPEGMIELVAVSRHPSDGGWWQPNGAPSSEGPFENSRTLGPVEPGQQAREFVFRTRSLRPEFSTPKFAVEGYLTSASGTPRLDGKRMRDGLVLAATFPEGLRTTTVRAGVAIDPWKTFATDTATAHGSTSFTLKGQPNKVTFLGAVEEKSGNTVLTLAHTFKEWNIRAVALDTEGHEHTSLLSSSTPEHLSATFVKLPRERIREFRFQIRPYRWAEFKDVHLQPSAGVAMTVAPWIRFTFTAVELREVAGVRWLAIDYLDDVHGQCEKSFPWEANIPGFTAEIRTSEFLKDNEGSPLVRHQRTEYRMPDSASREQLDKLRENLEKALKHKTVRLELGEGQLPLLLFELPGVESGSLKAWLKVAPPLKLAQ